MGKKGKAAKGRAKQKQKAQSQHGSGSGRKPPTRIAPAWSDSEDDPPFVAFRGFAQNKSFTPSSHRDPTVKLRHQAIAFVSATPAIASPLPALTPPAQEEDDESEHDGDSEHHNDSARSEEGDETHPPHTDMNLDDDKIPTTGIANMNIHSPSAAKLQDEEGHASDSGSSSVNIIGVDPDVPAAPAATSQANLFLIDTTGDSTLAAIAARDSIMPTPRPSSSAMSDSSQEKVLFLGRGVRTIEDPPLQNRNVLPQSTDSTPHVTDKLFQVLKSDVQASHANPTSQSSYAKPSPSYAKPQPLYTKGNVPPRTSFIPDQWASQTSNLLLTEDPNHNWKAAPAVPYWKTNKRATEQFKLMKQERDSEFRADKIALPRKTIVGPHPVAQQHGKVKGMPAKKARRVKAQTAAHLAFQDYVQNVAAQSDTEATRSEATPAVVSSFVSRPLEFMAASHDDDDDAIIPDVPDQDASSAWEDTSSIDSRADLDEESEAGSSELESELEYNEREMWEDEEDLRQRRQDAMDDEQIARLFQKQREFGIEGDELVLDDGDYVSLDDGFGDVAAARAGLSKITNTPTMNQKKKRKSAKGKNSFTYPDASALADAVDQYGNDGFDIMDFDRPSLRPTKKGRKGDIPQALQDLSDEEMRNSMTAAWDKDRAKKREKKAEREALRAAGLLHGPVPDLKQKYKTGMTSADVSTELGAFLADPSRQQCPFPPMDDRARKQLHIICHRVGLKSVSRGSGPARFPVVTKTLRTFSPGDDRAAAALKVLGTGSFTRADWGKEKSRKKVRGGAAKTSLQHGEIVGADAEEIPSSSFGHKMMEKMGWSRGMALGKDGEGRLEPVQQVMRIGKAGL